MRDIISGLDLLQAFPPVAAVTDDTAQVSNIVDLQGYDSVMLALTTGTLTDADAVWSVLIEDSPDGSTFTAVDDIYLNGTEVLAGFAFGDDNECRKIGYTGTERYLRATVDSTTANTGDLYIAGLWVLGNPSRQPTDNPPTIVKFT